MTLHPQHEFPMPEETIRVAHAAYANGNLYTFPFGLAARATRAVSSGIGLISRGFIDIASLLPSHWGFFFIPLEEQIPALSR